MSPKKPEESVKFKCLAALEQWMSWGYVIDYDDVSGLGKHMNLFTGRWTMRTQLGKRDLIAWFRVGRVLWTYLIECKAPGKLQSQRPEQIEYEKKWVGLDNVIYEVVDNYKQIHFTLDRLTEEATVYFRKPGSGWV